MKDASGNKYSGTVVGLTFLGKKILWPVSKLAIGIGAGIGIFSAIGVGVRIGEHVIGGDGSLSDAYEQNVSNLPIKEMAEQGFYTAGEAAKYVTSYVIAPVAGIMGVKKLLGVATSSSTIAAAKTKSAGRSVERAAKKEAKRAEIRANLERKISRL